MIGSTEKKKTVAEKIKEEDEYPDIQRPETESAEGDEDQD